MKTNKLVRTIVTLFIALTLAACAGTPKQESTGEYFDDTVITSKVKTALLNDPVVSGLAVNVETFKGVVQLSGFVRTAAERDRAHVLAHQVGGVTKVVNNILLR